MIGKTEQADKRTHFTERAWLEINLSNLRHNAKALQKAMPEGCALMAVVKCDAYGHGGVLAAKELERTGVRSFATATMEEAVRLRENGITGEILILGYTDAGRARDLCGYNLMQSVIGYEYARLLDEAAACAGVSVQVHIKIDTGMHRLGISAGKTSEAGMVFAMQNLEVCGIYTHLCCADSMRPEDIACTRGQIASFYRLTGALEKEGIRLPKLHIQSSYGLLNYPDLVCDYVRVGIALYGVLSAPNDDTVLKPDLRPVLSLKSRVVLIREVRAGESVGYGRSFTAGHTARIAILPIGYGDGFPRSLSEGKGRVLIRQYVAPVVGRICMDQLAVDITDAEGITVGDTATLVGAEGYDELSAPAVADHSDSISNELLCRMGARLPVITRSEDRRFHTPE